MSTALDRRRRRNIASDLHEGLNAATQEFESSDRFQGEYVNVFSSQMLEIVDDGRGRLGRGDDACILLRLGRWRRIANFVCLICVRLNFLLLLLRCVRTGHDALYQASTDGGQSSYVSSSEDPDSRCDLDSGSIRPSCLRMVFQVRMVN